MIRPARAIVLLLIALVVGRAAAQEALPPGLEPEPLVVESLGLSLHPPLGVAVTAERINGRLSLAMTDQERVGKWRIRVQQVTSTLEEANALAQLDMQLRQLEAAQQSFRLISNDAVNYGGTEGQLCFLEVAIEGGARIANGFLILPTGPQSFLVFSIECLADQLAQVRAILEPCFGTILITAEVELAARQAERLLAGQTFVQSLTPERLRLMVGRRQWYRSYRPESAAGPESERGYSLLEVSDGMRGQLSPDRAERDYDLSERERGLLVRVQGRIVVDASQNDYYDSLALYWMAWDGASEAWSIRATRRRGAQQESEGQTGVRTAATLAEPDAPNGKLTLIKSDTQRRTRQPFEWSVPSVYLSQGLTWLMGPLLAIEDAAPREQSYYAFNALSPKPRVSLRLDRWERTSDDTGNWRLSSHPSTDADPAISIIGPDARLVERRWSDGTLTVPIAREDLREIWRRQGLNMGD